MEEERIQGKYPDTKEPRKLAIQDTSARPPDDKGKEKKEKKITINKERHTEQIITDVCPIGKERGESVGEGRERNKRRRN